MLIMVLDHVRERFYFHHPVSDPINLDETHPELVITRLLAHLCAPTFVFLAGMSGHLYQMKNSASLAQKFLLKRGLFLVLLEILVINFSWYGEYKTLWLQVIWAIGISMLSLGAMIKLPHKTILFSALAIFFGHNLLDSIQVNQDQWGHSLWSILHSKDYIFQSSYLNIKASYPVLPWIGIILLGYCFGSLFSKWREAHQSSKGLFLWGSSSILLFVVLRSLNIYGDPFLRLAYSDTSKYIMSFLNVTKYPPSLDFGLLTIGISLNILALFENLKESSLRFLKVYGSAPLFFYTLHLFVLLFLFKIINAIDSQLTQFDHLYLIWIFAIILNLFLYFPTKWFAQYKRKSQITLLKYF